MLMNEEGYELPVNIIIAVIIGISAMAVLLSILAAKPPIPGSMNFIVDRAGTSPKNLQNSSLIMVSNYDTPYGIYVEGRVLSSSGDPIKGALCVISGLGGMATATSGYGGKVVLNSRDGGKPFTLPSGMDEGYLRIVCTASGYQKYENDNAVTVIKV